MRQDILTHLSSHTIYLLLTIMLLSGSIVSQTTTPPIAEKSHSSLTLFLENDIFANTDEQYTHGCGITWLSKEFAAQNEMPSLTKPFFKILRLIGETGERRNYSLSIRQDIFTPRDISDSNLIKNDLPYAGITYFPIGFYEKGPRSFSYLEFDIGLVGPHSYAGESQELIHKQLGNTEARGWDNQLRDEVILNLKFVRRWRVYKSNVNHRFQIELLPHSGFGVGNMKTFMNTGAQFRIGWPLPNDFGTDVVLPSCECPVATGDNAIRNVHKVPSFLIYLFGIMEGQVVIRDIFLDGNTFVESHSVDKKFLTGNAVLGFGLQVHRLKLNYLKVFQTKIYKTQVDPHVYGSLAISVLF